MSNKTFLIIGFLVVIAFAVIYIRRRPKTREEIIDYLNVNIGGNPAWTKMSDQELQDIYTYFRVKEEGVTVSPVIAEKQKAIAAKYANTFADRTYGLPIGKTSLPETGGITGGSLLKGAL